jgi:hypothetical protein
VGSGFTLHRALPVFRRVSDAANRSRSLFVFAIVRHLASARRHSCEGSGELGRLPLAKGAPSFSCWDLAGLRGAQPDGDPGPFDRCLQLTDLVFKMIALTSRHTPRRTSPRDAGPIGSRRWIRFGEPTARFTERFLLRNRPADVPLTPRRFAGFPSGTQASTSVGPPGAAMASFGSNPRA